MGFTDKSDIFASFHEDGFNRLLRQVKLQRPSLFNYATAEILGNPELFCQAIPTHPIVHKRGNPIATLVDPLPLPGTRFGLNFAVQLAEVRLDFHPGTQFALPPELAPPLAPQAFALELELCAGLGCPPDRIVDRYVPPPPDPRQKGGQDDRGKPPTPLVPLPTGQLICFCLRAFVVGRMVIRNYYGKPYLEMQLVGFEIVDIQPAELESGLECYARTMIRLAVLPQLRILLEQTVLDFKSYLDNLKKSVFVKIAPTAAPAVVAHNPAVEEDQVKLFLQVEVS